jgi:hypothetical protein
MRTDGVYSHIPSEVRLGPVEDFSEEVSSEMRRDIACERSEKLGGFPIPYLDSNGDFVEISVRRIKAGSSSFPALPNSPRVHS